MDVRGQDQAFSAVGKQYDVCWPLWLEESEARGSLARMNYGDAWPMFSRENLQVCQDLRLPGGPNCCIRYGETCRICGYVFSDLHLPGEVLPEYGIWPARIGPCAGW